MSKRTNEEWVTALKSDRPEAAISDLREHLVRGLTFTLASRIDTDLESRVQDFAQDAVLKVLEKIDTFRGESMFTTWAQKIAVRIAFTELRRKRWQDRSFEVLTTSKDGESTYTPAFLADPSPSPEERTTQQGMMAIVRRLIMEDLTERQREAMVGLLVQGLPMHVVVERLGTNRNALYKLMHDARVRLKRRLAEENLSPEEVLAVFETD